MNKGLEALERFKQPQMLADIDWNNRVSIIEKELKRLEELEKAFKALSKDDEKAKKLLSKEIEKNRALEIILKEFRFTFDDEEQSVMIDNCYTVIFHNKKKYELLKEVLL